MYLGCEGCELITTERKNNYCMCECRCGSLTSSIIVQSYNGDVEEAISFLKLTSLTATAAQIGQLGLQNNRPQKRGDSKLGDEALATLLHSAPSPARSSSAGLLPGSLRGLQGEKAGG